MMDICIGTSHYPHYFSHGHYRTKVREVLRLTANHCSTKELIMFPMNSLDFAVKHFCYNCNQQKSDRKAVIEPTGSSVRDSY